MSITPLLDQIETPLDLRNVEKEQLATVCKELREYIIDHVSNYGGHFGASLGVVELTVALHYVFDTPTDQLIWDVGHQAYGHKILTGRKKDFHTNRVYNGISGFPKRNESIYDSFGVGHSSTSISASLGMAIANKLKGDNRHHVAVIGDGALTGGMAFEAMNHAGSSNANLLIVLNDNCMSIDPNVGALKDYLTDIVTSKTYNKIKEDVWRILGRINKLGENTRDIVKKIEGSVKSFLLKNSNLFESLNLRYFGPVDGHDINRLIQVLEDLKNIQGPKILHCITLKGKGFDPAEKYQTLWHATDKFDKNNYSAIKITKSDKKTPPKYQDVFGNTLVELADKNENIIGVTPAMPSGSSMNIMMEKYPNRAFDVGIAEQHAVTLSAGMATQGAIVFCNIYSTFMQRAYDQLIHDVCLQDLPVIFCLDRAGLVGADGATHHGAYDLAFLRCIPNLIVSAPMNEESLRDLMFTATKQTHPFAIRYPRGQGVTPEWETPLKQIQVGKGRIVEEGQDLVILSIGHIGNSVREATKKLQKDGVLISHYDMQFVKPLDEELLHQAFTKHKYCITIEDGCINGGFGSAILEFMAKNNYTHQVKMLGIPDKIVEHGTQQELYKECGYDIESIIISVEQMLKKNYLKNKIG